MTGEAIDDLSIFSSTIPAGREQSRPAQVVIVACILHLPRHGAFRLRVALPPVWAFIPSYEHSHRDHDPLITAVLLFGHFRHAGSLRDHYILACGFLLAGCPRHRP